DRGSAQVQPDAQAGYSQQGPARDLRHSEKDHQDPRQPVNRLTSSRQRAPPGALLRWVEAPNPLRSVILSGAPQNCLENEFERRGVEGSRHCIVSRYCVKAFSREFPDAAWVLHTFSGSFDCAPFSFPKGQLLVALRSG